MLALLVMQNTTWEIGELIAQVLNQQLTFHPATRNLLVQC